MSALEGDLVRKKRKFLTFCYFFFPLGLANFARSVRSAVVHVVLDSLVPSCPPAYNCVRPSTCPLFSLFPSSTLFSFRRHFPPPSSSSFNPITPGYSNIDPAKPGRRFTPASTDRLHSFKHNRFEHGCRSGQQLHQPVWKRPNNVFGMAGEAAVQFSQVKVHRTSFRHCYIRCETEEWIGCWGEAWPFAKRFATLLDKCTDLSPCSSSVLSLA